PEVSGTGYIRLAGIILRLRYKSSAGSETDAETRIMPGSKAPCQSQQSEAVERIAWLLPAPGASAGYGLSCLGPASCAIQVFRKQARKIQGRAQSRHRASMRER